MLLASLNKNIISQMGILEGYHPGYIYFEGMFDTIMNVKPSMGSC